MKKAIKAISNIIELKPGKEYLLVFKMDTPREHLMQDIWGLIEGMKQEGITGLGVALKKGEDLEMIEAA
jgi:hypothetical protein